MQVSRRGATAVVASLLRPTPLRAAAAAPQRRFNNGLNIAPGSPNADTPVMERVSREQYERKVKHVQEAPDVKIGHLNPEGQIVEAESAQYVDLVKAVWNPVTRRAELVREGQGTRLTAWVKGGGYLHGYLEDIDPLAEFWDPERIDSSGGVMVMPQLGRIPGEAAKEMTVAEAIAAMMKYELEAPLGGSDDPMWYAEQEDLQVNLKKRGLYIRAMTAVFAVVALAEVYYFLGVWRDGIAALEEEFSFKRAAPVASKTPSLNK